MSLFQTEKGAFYNQLCYKTNIQCIKIIYNYRINFLLFINFILCKNGFGPGIPYHLLTCW